MATRPPRMSSGISALGFSPQELADLRRVYELFNVDGQDGIEVEELWKALRLLGFKTSRRRVQQMFSDLQVTTPGAVAASRAADYSVFLLVVNKLQGSSYDRHGEILQAFDYLDIDGDGLLSADDLKKAIANAHLGLSASDLDGMIDVADKNGDGMISKEEFVSVMIKTNLFR